MERIIRFRLTQPLTLNDFLDEVLKNPTCEYCIYHQECADHMGIETMAELEGYGCSSFDNTVAGLTKIYNQKYKTTPVGT